MRICVNDLCEKTTDRRGSYVPQEPTAGDRFLLSAWRQRLGHNLPWVLLSVWYETNKNNRIRLRFAIVVRSYCGQDGVMLLGAAVTQCCYCRSPSHRIELLQALKVSVYPVRTCEVCHRVTAPTTKLNMLINESKVRQVGNMRQEEPVMNCLQHVRMNAYAYPS